MAKRLIDSAELIAKLPVVDEDKQISLIGAVADVMVMISECQTVDAVEVVRCKDCKHAYINGFAAMSGTALCRFWSNRAECTQVVQQDDFCSYGERKEG